MSYTIAIIGKGGVGKTTVAALIAGRLIAKGRMPLLAVDADPNTCLDAALGVKVTNTIGAAREDARKAAGSGKTAGISKQELLNMKISEGLVEAEGFDLIAMGRSEGPGCYCYANNVLKQAIAKLSQNYPYVVIDNEAGLENLSRRIVTHVNLLVMVADPSRQGGRTAKRLYDLAREMEIRYDRLALVFNRLNESRLSDESKKVSKETKADLMAALPSDPTLAKFGESGESLLGVPKDNAVVYGIECLLSQALGEL